MSSEYRFVTFRQPTSALIHSDPNGARALTLDLLNSAPEIAEQMDGWDVVNTQVLPLGTEEVVIIFTLTTKVGLPEDESKGGEFWGGGLR